MFDINFDIKCIKLHAMERACDPNVIGPRDRNIWGPRTVKSTLFHAVRRKTSAENNSEYVGMVYGWIYHILTCDKWVKNHSVVYMYICIDGFIS